MGRSELDHTVEWESSILTFAHLRLQFDLGLCNFSGPRVSCPQPLDISDYLTPHIPFLVRITRVILDKGPSRPIARRHCEE